jgi:putative ABC transport system permease protein
MSAYYFDLALRSFRSSRALSLLMVLALALGIGACMTTLTVYHVLSGDPIPTKSARLFDVELDAASMIGYQAGQEPTFQLTRFDAEALLRAAHAKRQAMMTGANVPVQPSRRRKSPSTPPRATPRPTSSRCSRPPSSTAVAGTGRPMTTRPAWW